MEDETVNEQDLPADDENQEDVPFRQTVFNPEPSKMLPPRSQPLYLQDCNEGIAGRPLET